MDDITWGRFERSLEGFLKKDTSLETSLYPLFKLFFPGLSFLSTPALSLVASTGKAGGNIATVIRLSIKVKR